MKNRVSFENSILDLEETYRKQLIALTVAGLGKDTKHDLGDGRYLEVNQFGVMNIQVLGSKNSLDRTSLTSYPTNKILDILDLIIYKK